MLRIDVHKRNSIRMKVSINRRRRQGSDKREREREREVRIVLKINLTKILRKYICLFVFV